MLVNTIVLLTLFISHCFGVEILELTPISLEIQCTNCDQDLYTNDPNQGVKALQLIEPHLYQDFHSLKVHKFHDPSLYQFQPELVNKVPKLEELLSPIQHHKEPPPIKYQPPNSYSYFSQSQVVHLQEDSGFK